MDNIAPKDRDIAMVFQSYALYPSMTVRQNITFGMECRNVPRAQRDEAVGRVAKLLQIEALLDRKPGQLSGGQRQRVAMGRALVRDPLLFLFDEPLSNLDAQLRAEMRIEIKLLHQRLGSTIVYVTHDQIEAMTLATRIAVMRQGVVQQFADPETVYNRPANLFVARFMGAPPMNTLAARLEATRGRTVAVIGYGEAAIRFPVPPEAKAGMAVIDIGRRALHGVLEAVAGDGVGARDDDEIGVDPCVHRGVNFLHHFGAGDHALAGKMPALLGKILVLELDGIGAAALEHLNGARHVDRIAETGVGIDDQRQRDHIAHGADVAGEFGQRDQADIRHAEKGIGDAGAGDVDRLEPDIFDHARGQRIGRPRQQNGLAPAQDVAQSPIAAFLHRRFFHDRR